MVALLIFNYETYNPKRWHATLLMWAFSLSVLTGNFWFRRMIKVLQTVGAICHVTFFLSSVITLLVLARRSTPRYVFATLTNDLSGWTNPAVAWGIGLLTVTYTVAGKNCVLMFRQ
jgi:choline transport protein